MYQDEYGELRVSPTMIKKIFGIIGIFIALLIVFAFLPFVIIGAGERGIVMKLGKVQENVLEEGIHFKTPLQDNVVVVDVKTKTTEINGEAGSSDSQVVTFVAAINWRLDPKRVNKTYQLIGGNQEVEQSFILTKGADSIKAAISTRQAIEFQKGREDVRKKAIAYLQERVKGYVIIDDISFKNIDFSKEFNDAIEAKVTAEQEAQAQKNKLESVKYQAQQKIESSRAEAESIRIQTEALSQNQNLIELKKAEALLESAKKGVKIVPDTIIGDGQNMLYSIGK